MVALIVLLLLLAIFGGLGFVSSILWYVLIALLLLWIIGFFVGHGEPVAGGPRRHWYRW